MLNRIPIRIERLQLTKNQMIKKVNLLLVKHFGLPPRNSKLPDSVEMLIATILSQNTNDNNSYKAYQNLKKRFPTWDDVINAKVTSIEKEIKVAGLGKQKSRAIKDFLLNLSKDNGKLSLNFLKKYSDSDAIEALTRFNGVGVKTASCVLLFAMDRNVCPVDTHVHRTTNRIGIVKAKSPDKTFLQLNDDFPDKIAHPFHTNLIRLGREICKPQKPNCISCPLLKICSFKQKNIDGNIPAIERSFMLLDNIE